MDEHTGYRASQSHRWFGLGGTLLIYAIIGLIAFVTITPFVGRRAEAPNLTVFDIKAPAAQADPVPQRKQDVETAEDRPAPPIVERRPVPPVPSVTMQVSETALSRVEPQLAQPQPEKPMAPAPEPAAAPAHTTPAANSAPDSWEGQVLAALSKERRYPNAARVRRQQGVPYIRFVMDRSGRVLSCRLERSSGYAALDREAVALPNRAQPLPRPPADRRGETIELVVPVEFFMTTG
ncbi:protein TonB [Sphingobium sp. YR657]|uniref:energy transducer TonB family protein n=1 Tax=Sphingobium sp. YR657 TaxID=1884366 RepID=UPI000920CD75|nr:TonB family protein [Sphingobium sp. YR657]SHL52846.1 protein TonB [Sphingobium sp. YR657]